MLVFNLEIVGFFVIGAILSIFFHELGHYLEAEKRNLKPSYKLFSVSTAIDGSLKDQKNVVTAGLLWGLLPIMASFLMIGYYAFLLIPLYIVGCKSDIDKLMKIRRLK